MDVNLPDVHAEVSAVFDRYEQALVSNDVEMLDALFWPSPFTVRYGMAENLVGIEAIRQFRSARPSAGLARSLRHTVVTTYGRDAATAMTEFVRPIFEAEGQPRLVGRQSQTWMRTALPGHGGWRVVAAHVSVIPSTIPPSPVNPKEAA